MSKPTPRAVSKRDENDDDIHGLDPFNYPLFDVDSLLNYPSDFNCCDPNRFDDDSVRALRDDLLSDLWANLPSQVLPLRNMDAPV